VRVIVGVRVMVGVGVMVCGRSVGGGEPGGGYRFNAGITSLGWLALDQRRCIDALRLLS
jgi:hypothetical protein